MFSKRDTLLPLAKSVADLGQQALQLCHILFTEPIVWCEQSVRIVTGLSLPSLGAENTEHAIVRLTAGYHNIRVGRLGRWRGRRDEDRES